MKIFYVCIQVCLDKHIGDCADYLGLLNILMTHILYIMDVHSYGDIQSESSIDFCVGVYLMLGIFDF